MKHCVLMLYLTSTVVLSCGRTQAQAPAAFLAMPKELIPLDSTEGRQLFRESKANEAFWHLVQFYLTQPDSGSCSVASCIMVLNALPIERPISKLHGEYRLFTADNFFTPKVEAVRTRQDVSKMGMTLDQLAQVLATYPLEVTRHYATPDSVAAFREIVNESLQRPNEFILVNYLRKVLGQQTGGHISPLGAYNADRDMVLVLDVANFKYPWTWVKVDALWDAMEAVDGESKKPRGYIIVTPKTKT
jgi:hypothetical protein